MFFKILLNIFYSSIIIENEELIPGDENPCIICANHSNSVMDAIVLVTSVSRKVQTFCLVVSDVETEIIAHYCKGYNYKWARYHELVDQTKLASSLSNVNPSGTGLDHETKRSFGREGVQYCSLSEAN
jgi:hypothetical protein